MVVFGCHHLQISAVAKAAVVLIDVITKLTPLLARNHALLSRVRQQTAVNGFCRQMIGAAADQRVVFMSAQLMTLVLQRLPPVNVVNVYCQSVR